ncbi:MULTISPECIES: cysteine dioxygenase [unclassified Sphingomonas]|uniref:cysteine dioxygenase family protein n=1 Tax=unclassified Sphingomonas TaxID=196159 RepID=UPI0006FA9F40|nr:MULTISPECIES: cysteine dioxygenase [unclassified Sphingomonas]KQX25984.1 cysteine dioxygenase [Sphingomonas sp. Root1294]KQY69049.1 cysteine dioxygenase [Sphingomonas sp. Root50]KRB89304.1 cysteine dioxygenase [Sphingomonas sp. Root720]
MTAGRLRDAVQALTAIADGQPDEPRFLDEASHVLADLLAHDDWLPARFAQPSPDRYQQYLLHCDPWERFCIVSFVWGPGQHTPVHDHRVWGLIGVLRGAERNLSFEPDGDGVLHIVADDLAQPGDIGRVSPTIGDVHQVFNALTDEVSISIHIYGGNIGRIERAVFDPENGTARPFVSRFANPELPNIWND